MFNSGIAFAFHIFSKYWLPHALHPGLDIRARFPTLCCTSHCPMSWVIFCTHEFSSQFGAGTLHEYLIVNILSLISLYNLLLRHVLEVAMGSVILV